MRSAAIFHSCQTIALQLHKTTPNNSVLAVYGAVHPSIIYTTVESIVSFLIHMCVQNFHVMLFLEFYELVNIH